MRVLLTGASGYLGQHLLHSLIVYPIHTLDGTETATIVDNGDGTDEATTTQPMHVTALIGRAANLDAFRGVVDELLSAAAQPKCPQVIVQSLDITDAAAIDDWKKPGTMTAGSEMETETEQPARFEVCIHAAAMSSPRACQSNPEQAAAINVPTYFLDTLMKDGTHIIALSTDQVFDGKPMKPLTSSSSSSEGNFYKDPNHSVSASSASSTASQMTLNDPKPINLYGQLKRRMEKHLMWRYEQPSSHVPGVTILRSSIILGPAAPILPAIAHATFLQFIASRFGQPTTYFTNEHRNVISIVDVVAILRRLATMVGGRSRGSNSANDGNSNGSGNENGNGNGNENNGEKAIGIYHMGGPVRINRRDLAKLVYEYHAQAHNATPEDCNIKPGDHQFIQEALQESETSPLDISMDSTPLAKLVSMRHLETIIPAMNGDGGKGVDVRVQDLTYLRKLVAHTFPVNA
mmetsp:Transcript_6192/g.16841  ORF Transcript_6192/g.16841 Transcript_6192/m.16841 type:complete len:462 (-) Transcript_6192:1403-2788(-)